MSQYVLVHGAWEDAKSWDYVAPVLEANGHTVTALDLPGHGENMQPISFMNMANYIETIIEAINRIAEPVILVAHSMSGAAVSQVAERIPKKIERLVYVCSFLLQDGDTVLEAMQSDTGEFLPNIVFSEDQSYATLPEETLRKAGFHDVDEKVIQQVLPNIVEKQSTDPFLAKVMVGEENFGSVPKTYIRTTIDKVTTPDLQDRMIANWKVDVVQNLEAGHFPAFSVPKELADLLLQASSEAPAR
jgi:pimeloyl-ACP methyl ester carboxylesterase